MKKILIILVSLLVIGLSGCKATSQTPIEESRCDYYLIGLNGVESCYEVQEEETTLQGVKASDDLDKSKLPSYMLNDLGEYVTVDDLGEAFKLKYFGVDTVHIYDNYYKQRGETLFKFVIEDDLDANDVFVKIVFLLNELENYDYYFLSSTHVTINVTWIDTNGNAHRIIVETSSDNLLSDAISITPEAILDGDLELYYELMDTSLVYEDIAQYHFDYTQTLTFDGYVLNLVK